jgi:hypothetical protein
MGVDTLLRSGDEMRIGQVIRVDAEYEEAGGEIFRLVGSAEILELTSETELFVRLLDDVSPSEYNRTNIYVNRAEVYEERE